MNPNRQRMIMAAQKVRRVDDPKAIEQALKLTPEQRKAMYAPKPVAPIIATRPPMPVRVLKGTAKATGVTLAMITAIAGGLAIGESKRGFWS